MYLSKRLHKLEDIADGNNCDGDCDEKSPFIKCKECEACSLLNEIGELIDSFNTEPIYNREAYVESDEFKNLPVEEQAEFFGV